MESSNFADICSKLSLIKNGLKHLDLTYSQLLELEFLVSQISDETKSLMYKLINESNYGN